MDNPFRWCDNYPDNLDMDNMTLMSQAMANMVVRQAFNNKITSRSSNPAVYRPKTAIGADTRAHPGQ